MKLKTILIAPLAIIALSCSPKVVPTTQNVVIESKSEVVLTQNQIEGKAIFEANCAKCHKLYEPSTFKAEKWDAILKWMQPKAKISDAQREQVYDYVTNGQ